MNSAECWYFDDKQQPFTSEGIVQVAVHACPDFPLLPLSEAHWNTSTNNDSSSSTAVQRCCTSNLYVQSFVFAGRIE